MFCPDDSRADQESRASNAQYHLQVTQRDKEKYATALAKAQAEHDPALRAKLEFFAAKDATEVATDYERPDANAHTGLAPDFVQARQWYALATQHGDTDGTYYLGQMYWDGRGGPVDRERAKALWVWAAENGERKAVVKLESLGYNMQKERELAFGKARDTSNDAAMGALIVLGALLVARVAHDVNETPECREHRLAILAGTAPFTIMAGCN